MRQLKMLMRYKAQKIIRKKFPSAKITEFSRFKKGMINENYYIRTKNPKEELVLKVYPEEGWKAIKEKYLYTLVSGKKNIPVPFVHYMDTSKAILPHNYLLLSYIRGKELCRSYKISGNKELLQEAGMILAKIHSIKFKSFGWIVGKEVKPKFSEWKDFVFYDLRRKIAKLSRIPSIDRNFINTSLEFINKKRELLSVRSAPCLLHKDFHSTHIFSDDKSINGIIDFEWAIAGHNELDLVKSICWMNGEIPEIEEEFLKGYRRLGEVSNKFNERKKVYELILLLGMIGLSYEKKNMRWFRYNIKRANTILGC